MKDSLNAIIIDDEKHARQSLTSLLELYCPEVKIAATAENITQSISLIHQHQPDLVFLDVELEEESGFQLLDLLPEIDFQLIFTTAHSKFAIKAFRYHAIDYLLKPIQPSELVSAVNRAKYSLQNQQIQQQLTELRQYFRSGNEEKLVVSTMEGLNFIKTDSIVHIVGSGNYSTFHLSNGEKIMASKNLKHYVDLLPAHIFFRTHQSHLISLRYITKIKTQEGLFVALEGGHCVPLTRARKDGLVAMMEGIR